MKRKVAVIAVGQTEYTSIRRETRSKAELAFAAVGSALDSVGISLSDIDATVWTSVDGFEGIVRPDRTIDAYGQGHNLPLIAVNTGGTAGGSGFKEAVHLISAGIYDLVLVYGAPTFGEIVDAQEVLVTAMPPLMEKPLGMSAVHIGSLYATGYIRGHNRTEEDLALIAAKNHQAATKNPYAHLRKGYSFEEVLASEMIAWPLRIYEICPVSSGAVAIIIASEGKAEELCDTPVWVKAIDSIANTFISGFRNYKDMDLLEILTHRVYSATGIKNARKEIDIAEVFNPYVSFECQVCEALGFCEKGQYVDLMREGVTLLDGKLPVNPSGGVLCTNSGISASLTRHAEVVLQLMGKAEGRQVKSPEIGLAHAWGGSDGQFDTIAILSRHK